MQLASAELASRMRGLKQVLLLIVCTIVLTTAQYIDDSDYEDYGSYEELIPHTLIREQAKGRVKPAQEDLYLINDYEESASQNDVYSINDEIDLVLANKDGSLEMIQRPYKQPKWFQTPAKIYQYTKHRIPGYDYDELDFMGGRRFDKCDSRSVWSHCVCQFTCSNPSEVDCYMPCTSGCECKEDFVFNEDTAQCILPEMCANEQNFDIIDE
ncbi:uncharacterized protein LOC105687715 [Athalia rosae]|uniref:uncharacterized protein LOC105687715 n=1 Tax=Athalia rosae TaxID=37344 RepID=UPI00062631A5|nr:uncharacterized protein LOC105687715 [Athalia rosae]XP_012258997.1 uncharacterized protein LOC105687715 [Athalia rosae]XP_012259002.1 uncharacterized protein LOC105687715 [Athalia rosae]XP_012259008.1 uncharacterized protein LOC105687715 [Athalia rosae]